MPSIEVCDVKDWVQFATLVAVIIIEAWLGKTEKTKSGSLLEMTIRGVVRIIKTLVMLVLFKSIKKGELPVDQAKAKANADEAKAKVPMSKAYDLKVLGARLKEVGVENGEQLAGEIYFVSKEWAKESAPLSENKIDDVAAPFYDQADQFVLPQLEKIAE